MTSALRLSIVANVVLVGTLGFLLSRDPSSPQKIEPVTALPKQTQVGPSASPEVQSSSTQTLNPSVVSKLEKMGISRDAVANLLLQEFDLRSTKRLAQLQKKYAPRRVPEREMVEFSRRCELERTKELKETLGEDGYRDWDKGEKLHELNRARPPGDEVELSAADAEQAYLLQKDFDEKVQSLHEAMEDGVADKADAGALEAQAQLGLDSALEKLLGKQRLDELHGNIDPSTAVLREYASLNPTSDQTNAAVQAEAAYRAQQDAIATQLNQNPADSANLTTQLKALNDAESERLRQIFGATAYDKMKLQSDPTYQTLTHYAGAWNLQDSEVQSTYQTIHDFQTAAENIRNAAEMSQTAGQPVNWIQVNGEIAKAEQQTETSLQSTIGDERLRRLKQNGVIAPP